MDNLQMNTMKRLRRTAEALEKNNMEAFVVSDRDEARKLVLSLIPEGSVVASGGTRTAAQCGIIEAIRNGPYSYLDRETVDESEIGELYRKSFFADIYISGSNAVTENGELYNVDGNSNRVAAICYGPKEVIIVVGYNKIVGTVDDAVARVKRIAAPTNAQRLGIQSYCHAKGECASLAHRGAQMCEGCDTDARICCNYLVSAHQRIKNRIKVVLVCEELGF